MTMVTTVVAMPNILATYFGETWGYGFFFTSDVNIRFMIELWAFNHISY